MTTHRHPAFHPGPLLDGRVAIVTGGAGGIGEAVTRCFAAHRASVVLVDHDAERAEAVAGHVAAAGGDVLPVVADVTDPDALAGIVPATLDRYGTLDVVVNNVGHFVTSGRGFLATDESDWAEVHAVNLEHVLRLTRDALPTMIDHGRGGAIVNLSTVEAFRGVPHHPVYAAYKAAVTQFSKSLALDVGRFGIRVNDVAPDVVRSLQIPYDKILAPGDEAKIPTWVPVGRLGEPEDVAGAVLFLASDLGSFVTGTTIHVDGGTYAAGGWYPTTHGPRPWTNRPFDP